MAKNPSKSKRRTQVPSKKATAPANPGRRSFVKFGVLAGGALGVWATLADTAGLLPWLKLASNKLRYGVSIPDATQVAAKLLFGIREFHTSIVPAASNPNVRERLLQVTSPLKVSSSAEMLNYFSRATVEASAFLQPLFLGPIADHFAGYDRVEELLRANKKESIVALGTPTSNSLIRDMMLYREREDSRQGHEHQPNDAVRFPILFELRRERIVSAENQRDAWYRPKSLSGEASSEMIPNWGITDTHGELLLPATDGEGRLLEDFLVISSVPNMLDPECVERNLPVTCIGGTHSVGTVALRELLEHETILHSLVEQLSSRGSPKFWQAVIRVQLDPESGQPASLLLEPDLIGAIEVDKNALMREIGNMPILRA